MNPQCKMSTEFPADKKSIGRAKKFLKQFSESALLPESVAKDLLVVIDELHSNSVKYGHNDELSQNVEIEISLADSQLTLKYSDEGKAFNPFAVQLKDLDIPVEDRENGGLGIHLVRRLTDSQSYKREDNRNIIVLTRRVS